MTPPPPNPLAVKGLKKRFGGLVVTNDVSLVLEPGQIHAVIGPNGAGKTTLIKQICGEIRPDSGQIFVCGEDITGLPTYRRARRGLGRTFQITSVMKGLTTLDNVALAVQGRRGHSFRFLRPVVSERALAREAAGLLERVGLAPDRHPLPASALSHGEHRKLELAMALACEPRLLLLDEPLAGTGVEETAPLIALLRDLKGQLPILLVEHDMHAVFSLADTVTVLVDGRVIAQGPPSQVRDDPAVLEAYLGEEELAGDHEAALATEQQQAAAHA